MKIKHNNPAFLIAFFLLPFFAHSQQQNKCVADAEKDYKELRYFDAIDKFKTAYSKVKDKEEKVRMKFMTAECYRKIHDTKLAEEWYAKVVALNYKDPIVYFWYAEMLMANDKYEDAIANYNIFKQKAPDDSHITNADLGIKSAIQAKKWKDNPSRYDVENMKKWNSKENDHCLSFADKKNYKTVYFASSREGATGKGADAWTGQSFQDIFSSTLDKKGSWSTPTVLPAPINTDANEGCACVNDKGTTMYYTVCGKEKKKNATCQIYVAEKKAKLWDVPQRVVLGPDTCSFGQPSLSDNELELYFVSNMPGGFGGNDIWVVKRDGKKKNWGTPINLGENINTSSDELTPFIRNDSTLYFASSGHVGMGGLDIFKVKKSGGVWGTPENMLSPINSPSNDFAIVFEGKEEKGYFTSDRIGSGSEDNSKSKGGYDIWRFYMPPLVFTLSGNITDDSSKKDLSGVLVQLVRSDGFSVSSTTDKKGFYKFDKDVILPNSTFTLTFSKVDYFSKKAQESTVGIERSKDIVLNETLVKIPEIPIELPEILYDLGKWELKPQFRDSLNGLIKTLELNPKIAIELSSHTDSRPIPMTNTELSRRRAMSVIDYLISKGIAADRLKAKGAGETEPKILLRDSYKDGVRFKKGSILSDEFISSLKTTKEKEAAHALNRRTEFKVISKNYVPSKNTNIEAPKVELMNNSNEVKPSEGETKIENKKEEPVQKIEEQKKPEEPKPDATPKKDTKSKKRF